MGVVTSLPLCATFCMRRAVVSIAPPGVVGTTSSTGFSGFQAFCWACEALSATAEKSTPPATARNPRCILMPR